jgi:5-methylcytosine-specific restriction endonuclease McrA
LICKKDFHLKPSAIKNGQGKFCSRSCKIENQRLGIEVRNESYNDRHLIRQSSEYRTWREKAKRLKGNKCEKCGIKDRSICKCCGTQIFLHVHHIKAFATYPELRFNPQNASVLCPKCHLGHR